MWGVTKKPSDSLEEKAEEQKRNLVEKNEVEQKIAEILKQESSEENDEDDFNEESDDEDNDQRFIKIRKDDVEKEDDGERDEQRAKTLSKNTDEIKTDRKLSEAVMDPEHLERYLLMLEAEKENFKKNGKENIVEKKKYKENRRDVEIARRINEVLSSNKTRNLINPSLLQQKLLLAAGLTTNDKSVERKRHDKVEDKKHHEHDLKHNDPHDNHHKNHHDKHHSFMHSEIHGVLSQSVVPSSAPRPEHYQMSFVEKILSGNNHGNERGGR